MSRLATTLFVLAILTSALASAQSAPIQPLAQAGASASGTDPKDLQGLRDDLERMKGLVQQMENNLAFVDTTQSPLKHQFQLEIDLWKILIRRMERRLPAAKP